MVLVSSSLAEWLRAPELVELVEDAAVLAAWTDLAADSATSSPLALRADALAEAQRQIDFLGLPISVEMIEVAGRQSQLVGEARRIEADVAEYAAPQSVFVIGADERDGGVTLLTVLRKVEAA
ncbi:MAG: hypothetical protein H6919_11155 [Sphingomonadaceae bacterium]|nr:hypothetical protein [Sphingomonadaceae bacterium]MCP5383510.1 hypothetical protein [Altererythrobacter sp.]MCP5394452.1 hypothetical protein [Sphingomonadaceae bacterium]